MTKRPKSSCTVIDAHRMGLPEAAEGDEPYLVQRIIAVDVAPCTRLGGV